MRSRVDECPRKVLCEPDTKTGPLVRIRVRDNPRLNVAIPRGTDRSEELKRKRSGAERFFSWLKEAGRLGKRPYRRRYLFEIVAGRRALGAHALAWVKRRFGDTKLSVDDFRTAVMTLLEERAAA